MYKYHLASMGVITLGTEHLSPTFTASLIAKLLTAIHYRATVNTTLERESITTIFKILNDVCKNQ